MKSTGITRKIDDLGRIVIPKELRKKLLIDNNDELEIYVEENSIILKKYERLLNIKDASEEIINIFKKHIDFEIMIANNNKFVFSTIKEYENIELNKDLKDKIHERKIFENTQKENLKLNDNLSIECIYSIYPIIKEGALLGGLISCSSKENADISKFSKILIELLKVKI